MKRFFCLLGIIGSLLIPSFTGAVQGPRAPQEVGGLGRPKVAIHFSPSILTLAPGETYPVTVTLVNLSGRTIPQALAQVICPPGLKASFGSWIGRLPIWGVKFFPKFTAGDLSPGSYTVKVEAFSEGKRLGEASYRIKIVIPSLDLIPDPIKNAVQVWVGNPHLSRRLKGRVILSNPNRLLQDIVSSLLDLDPGQTTKVSIPLAGGMAPGIAYQFTVRLETWEGFQKVYSRNLTFFTIPKAFLPPPLEGSFRGWEEVPSLPISRPVSAPGVRDFGGPKDVAGSVRFQWDEKYLYLFAVVRDNGLSAGDQIEVGLCLPSLSPRNSKPVRLILPARKVGEVSRIQAEEGRALEKSVFLVTRRDDRTYYSARFSWSDLEVLHPSSGQPLRLAVRIQDADEGRVRGWLEWGGGLGGPVADPSQFWDVMLGE